jgi:hypothetical protein
MSTLLTLYLTGIGITAGMLAAIVIRLPASERPELSLYVAGMALWAILAWPLTWGSIAVWVWEGSE